MNLDVKSCIPSYVLDKIEFSINEDEYLIFLIAFKHLHIERDIQIFYNCGSGYVLYKNKKMMKMNEIDELMMNTMRTFNFEPRDKGD